jgi:bifunctional UDP-N-acetylglucosamine pyrophosphorylase / glucosamine-1-phosphate N-acetyltransferase
VNTPSSSDTSALSAQNFPLIVAILAAGKGKRMGNPDVAKVLTLLHQKPLLGYVLDVAQALAPKIIYVIVGHQAATVEQYAKQLLPHCQTVLQAEQFGTGHAVQQVLPYLPEYESNVLVLSGDVPLLRSSTLARLLDVHQSTGSAVTLLTTVVQHPLGYGRIVRASDNSVLAIVEEKDASEQQRKLQEINAGVYVFRSSSLSRTLQHIRNSNAQGEFYLTDTIGLLAAEGQSIAAYCCPWPQEVQGINTVDDLMQAEQAMDTLAAQR